MLKRMNGKEQERKKFNTKLNTNMIMKILWFYIIVFLLAPHGDQVSTGAVPTEPKFQHFRVSAALMEADTTCRELPNGPWSLPVPSSGDDIRSFHRELAVYMESAGMDQAWLPLKNTRLSGWINNEPIKFEGRVQENGDKRKTCGLLKLRYEAAVSDFCESSGYGHVCEMTDCQECPPQVSPHNCIRDGKTCYLLGCDAGSWFEASNRCVAMGTRLAVMNTEEQVAHIVKSIKKRPKRKCRRYWTSLVKEKWAFNSKDYGGEESPNLYFWSENEPHPSHDCAVVRKYEDGFYWKSVNCSSRHHFICMKTGTSHHQSNTSSMNITSPTPHSENLGNNETTNIREPKRDGGMESQLKRICYCILSIVIIQFIIHFVFIILCLIKRQSMLTYVELPTQM